MKTLINGVNIAYDDHGIGQPVLFLHAFPVNRNMWEGETKALLGEGRYRLVALDWPGFGESEISTNVLLMEQFADIVAGVMDTLGMQDAILCGLSMGGYAAFAFLRKYPERVRGLILADTRPGGDTEEAQVNREHVARLAESQGTSAIADMQLPKLISDETRHAHPEVELRIRQMIEVATSQGIAAASRGMAQRADSTDLLESISCPSLVIVGEKDVLTPVNVARNFAAKMPDAQLVVIPQSGHLSNLEQPVAFLQAISVFLQSSFP